MPVLALTFSDFQTYVLDRLNIPSNDTTKVTQIKNILNWVNEKLHEMFELKISATTLSITANNGNVTVPTDFARVKYILNNTVPVDHITERDFATYLGSLNAGAGPTLSNPPAVYTWRPPQTLSFLPVPTANVTLNFVYVQRPIAMSAGTDTPDALPMAYADLLCEWAVLRMALTEENTANTVNVKQLAEEIQGQLAYYRIRQAGKRNERVALKVYG